MSRSLDETGGRYVFRRGAISATARCSRRSASGARSSVSSGRTSIMASTSASSPRPRARRRDHGSISTRSWAVVRGRRVRAPAIRRSPRNDHRGDRFVTPAKPVLVRGIRSSSGERVVVHIAPRLDGDERSGPAMSIQAPARSSSFCVTSRSLSRSSRREDVDSARVERTRPLARRRGLSRAGRRAVSGGLVEEARALVAFGATPDEAIARLRRPGVRLARRPRRRTR